MKIFFYTFIAIIILGLIGAGVYLWYQGRISKGLELTLNVPEEIKVSTPFTLEVKVSNSSKNVLEDTQLLIELPKDIVFVGSSPGKVIETRELGNLGSGSLAEESFKLMVLGGENTVREIKAKVSYLPDSLGSRFEKSGSVSFSVTESSIIFDVSLPQKVFSGEEFETVILYKNTSEEDFDNLSLKISYPPTFTFKSASREPSSGNNVWDLGTLGSGKSGRLTVKGKLIGPDGSFFDLITSLTMSSLGKVYEVLKKTASISISKSPLSLKIDLNNNPEFIAFPGSDLNYTLTFKNSTDIGLRDVIVRAKLIGEMFDLETLSANASLEFSNNTLIWNTSNNPFLSVLSPGSSNSVSFTLKAKKSYPIKRLSDKNFTLKVEAEIESPTVPHFVSADKTSSVAESVTKVGGQILVDAQGFFRDANAGIVNRGPWPPKVGKATNFTIHLVVRNFSNDVNNLRIKAFLGNNVKSTGVIKSNIDTKPSYNERTKEVVWDIDRIQAGKGIFNEPLRAIFQVEATPSVNQLGSFMVLLQAVSFEGTDDFTNELLVGTDKEITTLTLDDKTVSSNDGIVVK